MPNFAEKVAAFNRSLEFTGKLPKEFRVMNPFRENPEVLGLSEAFYRKFYNDSNPRRLILGINPGRLGAGATGIPFTDSRRLAVDCGIQSGSIRTHEPSSVFVYDMIRSFGGVYNFYGAFYITSVCPLGFLRQNRAGRWVNCNYYDDVALFTAAKQFILWNLKTQAEFGIERETVFVMGKQNADIVGQINRDIRLFRNVVVLDHPRYIEQYRSKKKEAYIKDYVEKLRSG
jgi:hypothetical protein